MFGKSLLSLEKREETSLLAREDGALQQCMGSLPYHRKQEESSLKFNNKKRGLLLYLLVEEEIPSRAPTQQLKREAPLTSRKEFTSCRQEDQDREESLRSRRKDGVLPNLKP